MRNGTFLSESCRNTVSWRSTLPVAQSILWRFRYSIESGELVREPMPLSVITQNDPSAMTLMPEWPCSGWPLNGSDRPVGRSLDLPITLPMASTRRPVVYLPEVFRSSGASAGASITDCAGSTACPASLAGNTPDESPVSGQAAVLQSARYSALTVL